MQVFSGDSLDQNIPQIVFYEVARQNTLISRIMIVF